MDKTTAQTTIKNINEEAFSLNPSALIQLFEIDISDIGFNMGIISSTEIALQQNTIFRFHNNVNLTIKSIFWQGNEFIAAPIKVEGMDMNSKGEQVTPKLSMTVSDDGIPQLARLKDRLYQMGDIVGAKVTRIRTFAKFLDEINFSNESLPNDFLADPNAELPRDIFYIDRKSIENKNMIEYELSSLFDVEGIKLPGRIVSQDACCAQYRGEGCLYEYSSRRNVEIHKNATLPNSAPPVANSLDEKFSDIIGGTLINKGLYNKGNTYNKGDFIYLTHRGLNYYFVSKINNNKDSPLLSSSWEADECSKRILGCKLRWNENLNYVRYDSYIFMNDEFPNGYTSGNSSNGGTGKWSTTNPTPYLGDRYIKTNVTGNYDFYFIYTDTNAMVVNKDDNIILYVNINSAYAPSGIMLQLKLKGDDGWNRRAYWGSGFHWLGNEGTETRYRVGDLPALNEWVKLSVPASALALDSTPIVGATFSIYKERSSSKVSIIGWDSLGKEYPIKVIQLPINAFSSCNRFR